MLSCRTFIILIVFALFTSCNHYYYVPNEGATLALKEKNDLQLAGGIGLTPFINPGASGSVQVGYSPIKNLGIQSSYFSVSFDGNLFDTLSNGKVTQWSNAIGAYHSINLDKDKEVESNYSRMKANRYLLLDAYIGYDVGRTVNKYSRSGISRLNFNKRYIQLGTHFYGRFLDFGITFRTGILDYTRAKIRGNVSDQGLSEIDAVVANDAYRYGELGLRYSINLDFGKVYGTLTRFYASYPVTVNFRRFVFQAGYVVNLNTLFKKRKSKNKK